MKNEDGTPYRLMKPEVNGLEWWRWLAREEVIPWRIALVCGTLMLCWQDPIGAIDSFQEDDDDPDMEEDESGLSKVKEVLLLERSCARKISKDPSFSIRIGADLF